MNNTRKSLNVIWQKAAVIGSLWAAVEIILGSFLHNLRVPFSGMILAAIGVCLLVSSNQVWHEKGIFWRAGIICAVMKSISPSAVILGPMIGIIMEGFLLELAVLLLGRNILGYSIGGAFAVLSTFFQSIFLLLLMYGFNLVELYVKLYQLASKNLKIEYISPWDLVLIVISIYILFGISAAFLGFYIGKKTNLIKRSDINLNSNSEKSNFLEINPNQKFSLSWFAVIILSIISGLLISGYSDIIFSFLFVSVFVALCFYRYNNALTRFKKPKIWIEFSIIILLAAIILGGVRDLEQLKNGVLIGLQMILRAILIILGFAVISIELRNPKITSWIFKLGMGNLYHAVELAFEALPVSIQTLGQQKQLFKRPIESISNLIATSNGLLLKINKESGVKSNKTFVTGIQGGGKTSAVSKLVKNLSNQGFSIGGILAPGFWNNGQRSAFEIVDIRTNEKRLLCDNDSTESIQRIGQFHFKKKGLELGKKALAVKNLKDVDLIVVDEVGALELSNQGWSNELERLFENVSIPIIINVRDTNIDEVCTKWNIQPFRIYNVNNGGIDESEIVKLIKQDIKNNKKYKILST